MPNSPYSFIDNQFKPNNSPNNLLPNLNRPKLSPHDLNSNNINRNSYFLINNNDQQQQQSSEIINSSNNNGFFDSIGHTRTSSQTSIGSTSNTASSSTLSHLMRGPPSPSIPSPSFLSSTVSLTSTSSLPSKRTHPPSSSSSSSATSSNHQVKPSPSAIIHSNRYKQFTPASIISLLLNEQQQSLEPALLTSSSSAPSILLLDIRTHTAFFECRFKSSVNICVPSTLLRRPNYGVDRISEGLMPLERVEFEKWSSVENIIVLDSDSMGLKEGGGVSSLLAKFSTGFEGTLGYVKGGFKALKAEAKLNASSSRELLQYGEGDSIDGSNSSHSVSAHSTILSSSSIPTTPGGSSTRQLTRPILQVRDLPISAFQQASTSAFAHAGLPSASLNMGGRPTSSKGTSSKPGISKRRKSDGHSAFGLNIDMPTGLATGSTTPGGNSIAEKRMATNPFFDNIRQNSEALSLTRSLANLSPIELPEVSQHDLALLPPFLVSLLKLTPMERAQLLARQFYELEVAERERLEGTLNWHATVQHVDGEKIEENSQYRKFGISAGVELGNLNRFKNIFPYDCARVRLQVPNSSSTDYINASHVHIETSPKRFIASQGPLPTTFSDFFQVCVQEKVGVIIMLTNLQEGGREKCGNYWKPECNDLWDVKVEGGEDHEEVSTGFFNAPTLAAEKKEVTDSTIRRTFYIRRKGDSNPDNVRKIRHIQYRAWPDFDVPATSADLVELVKEVEQAQKDYLSEVGWKGGIEDDPPIMTHCSGGIGRTGVFIAVLTLLDKLRRDRELISRFEEQEELKVVDDMDVDSQPAIRPHHSYTSTSSSSSDIASNRSSSPPSSSSFSNVLPSPTLSVHSDTATASLALNLQSSTLNSTPTSNWPSSIDISPTSSTPTPINLNPASIPPPLLRHDPIFASVNEMRMSRMSMVATLRQYVSIYEATLVGYLELFKKDKEEKKY